MNQDSIEASDNNCNKRRSKFPGGYKRWLDHRSSEKRPEISIRHENQNKKIKVS